MYVHIVFCVAIALKHRRQRKAQTQLPSWAFAMTRSLPFSLLFVLSLLLFSPFLAIVTTASVSGNVSPISLCGFYPPLLLHTLLSPHLFGFCFMVLSFWSLSRSVCIPVKIWNKIITSCYWIWKNCTVQILKETLAFVIFYFWYGKLSIMF